MIIEEIYSTKEIAEILRMNQSSVRLLIQNGKMEAIDVSLGKTRPVWKITQSQLNKYLDDQGIKYKEGEI